MWADRHARRRTFARFFFVPERRAGPTRDVTALMLCHCRYFDNGDRDLSTMGRGLQGNRASQYSRFSDTALQVPSHGGVTLDTGRQISGCDDAVRCRTLLQTFRRNVSPHSSR